MKVIKEAFVEGRETETDWEVSEAKANEIKMGIALENYSSLTDREKMKPFVLLQICPMTGKTLNVFPSRLKAAEYVVKHILNSSTKKPISVTGNMEVCIRAGWKSYGYYWKISQKTFEEELKNISRPTSTTVRVKNGASETSFPSIKDAAIFFGITPRSLSKNLANDGVYIVKMNKRFGSGIHEIFTTNNNFANYSFSSNVTEAEKKQYYLDREIQDSVAKKGGIMTPIMTSITVNGKTTKYNSISQAAKVIGLTARDLSKKLKKNRRYEITINNKLFTVLLEPAIVEPAIVEPAIVEPAIVEPAIVEPVGVWSKIKNFWK